LAPKLRRLASSHIFVAFGARFVARGGAFIANRWHHVTGARPMRAMKTPSLLSIAICIASLAVFLGTAATARSDGARSAIEAQSRALSAALAHHDAAAAGGLFTEDARLSVPGATQVVAGREAITNFWRMALDGGLTGLTLDADEVEGEGALRFESGNYLALGKDGAEMGRGQYLIVWKKDDGTWRVHRDFAHSNGMPPRSAEAGANASAAAGADRVGFPRDYSALFRRLGATLDRPGGLTTVFANEIASAASASEGAQFPNGSVILMEFANPQRDGEEQLLRDAHGQPLKGEIAHIDVMRRGAGFGAMYGASRAGEWEFASYRPDGSTLIPPDKAEHCAACHLNAGAGKDFVFRTRSWNAAESPTG